MADLRNVQSEDLIYFFQIKYLHQMRRKTKPQIYPPKTNETKISKSNSFHIPSSNLNSQNLFNTFANTKQQKKESNKLQFKPQSISTKQLNQIFINNRNIIRRQRVSSIQHQPDKCLDSLITRKKSTNYTFIETSQKRIMGSQQMQIEKSVIGSRNQISYIQKKLELNKQDMIQLMERPSKIQMDGKSRMNKIMIFDLNRIRVVNLKFNIYLIVEFIAI